MNPFEERLVRVIRLLIDNRDEQISQTGDSSFENRWLQEKTGFSIEELNRLVDYLQDREHIQAYRPGGGAELPFFFKTINLLPTGEHWYYETVSREEPQETPRPAVETKPTDPSRVFVVHGRNEKARDALFQFLRTIGLKPIEWSEAIRATGNPAPYVGEILDAAFSMAQAVVVLMTPDDMAYLRQPLRGQNEPAHETEPTPQARPNVLFEAGMALGRHPRRTVLVELGQLRPFSDVAGRHAVRINNLSQRRQDLADRLALAECPVDLSNRDWHTAGDFDAALEVFDEARKADLPFTPDRPTGPLVEVRVGYERNVSRSTAERHEYSLVVEIENVGSLTLIDYRVDILFPKVFMDIETYGAEFRPAETSTHKLVRRTAAHFPQLPNGLFPGDKIEDKQIKYSVDMGRYMIDEFIELPVEVTVVANGMVPQKVTMPMWQLQDLGMY